MIYGLSHLKKVYIIGIGGTLMGSFACFLKRQGILVSGSDATLYPPISDILHTAEIPVYSNYDTKNITQAFGDPDCVLVGNVIRKDNIEVLEAQKRFTIYSLPEMLEKYVLHQTKNLVVAGTHGKTTTSSLLAHTLVAVGKNPSYLIGGIPLDLPVSFHIAPPSKEPLFVLEGDEYDTAFWDKVPKFSHYLPSHLILTSIEYDHADIYPNFDTLKKVFFNVCKKTSEHIIGCFEDPVIKEFFLDIDIPKYSYGFENSNADFIIKNIQQQRDCMQFEVESEYHAPQKLELSLSGRYNLLNAVAVWIECILLGINPQSIQQSFQKFRGVKRRQQILGTYQRNQQKVLLMEDFAHHPTALRVTLEGLKERYRHKKIICLFEPRSATSRRKIFQEAYVNAFQSIDVALIATPYDQTRIALEERFSSETLVKQLCQTFAHKKFYHFTQNAEAIQYVLEEIDQQDALVVVCSNGGFNGLLIDIQEALNQKFNFFHLA